jgi:hypothetical protein
MIKTVLNIKIICALEVLKVQGVYILNLDIVVIYN